MCKRINKPKQQDNCMLYNTTSKIPYDDSIIVREKVYINNASIETMTASFKNTFLEIQGDEVVERLLTAFTDDESLIEILKIYHEDAIKRWKAIEKLLKTRRWRYVHTTNYVSMIVLGLQHYCDELSSGRW